jgi:hypothetical protein
MLTEFQTAERYIELRKKCVSQAWVDTIMRFNEMVIAPIITLFFIFTGNTDIFAILSSSVSVYRAWSEWLEYSDLRFEVQDMFLKTMASGGPQIVTNDPDYMAYVYADAVFRQNALRRHS